MKMPPPIATKFTKLVLTILAITILGIILSFVSQDHTLLMLSAGVAVAGGVKIIDYYFGIDLLQQLRQYYEGRLSLALAKGFDQQDAKYHWLFKELECRVSTLRKLMSMISVLPEFMCRQTEEQIFAMVIGHTTTWFSNENLGGEQPRDAKGNCLYYQDTNPYWVDMREAMDRFTLSYDYTHLSTFYADLVEYIVMTVRLYFFIREKQFRPIDRGKYDELVGVKAALPTPA